ncbi:MAG: hypothetical protein ABI675_11820 [Chitinophagaceae bacterium]
MSRKLKDFIDENRRAFDDDLPSASAWQRIEKTTGAGKPVKKITVRDIYKWSAAAAVFFIIATGIYFAVIRKKDEGDSTVKVATPAVNNGGNTADIGKIAPEYAAEAKKIYKSIEEQQQQLKQIAKEQPELYSQFAQDLAALDSSYRVLKLQAIQAPGHEILIKAMLQNLQLQAELLGKQLLIIHEFNNHKTDNNEKNNNRSI